MSGLRGASRWIVLALALAFRAHADPFSIGHMDHAGQLQFTELPTAVVYRVLWAPSLSGEWQCLPGLASVPAARSGTATTTIPMTGSGGFYRVVATVETPPALQQIRLGNGAPMAGGQTVELSLDCTGDPLEVMVSENADFSGASWQPYSSNLRFTLTPISGDHTLYVRVRLPSGIVSPPGSVTFPIAAPPPAPAGMVHIPAGEFLMGDSISCTIPDSSDGGLNEYPVHTVDLDAYFMDRCEVSKALWDTVYTWATNHHYTFDNPGSGKDTNHPVQQVSWFDCVKWCNARSLIDGFTPCYTVAGAVYTAGQQSAECDWTADGYRLPTEAEWEKAARGGAIAHRFPWSDTDTILYARANFCHHYDSPYCTEESSSPYGYHPDWDYGDMPYTSVNGAFPANGYGLRDMCGNVSEWCWDWYEFFYYKTSPFTNPRGPESSSDGARVTRGGNWASEPGYCRVACRGLGWTCAPSATLDTIGFRTVRRAPPQGLVLASFAINAGDEVTSCRDVRLNNACG